MSTLTVPSTANAAAPALEITRVLRVPRTRLYEAWTTPEIMKKWFGPATMYCPNAELDVREGGAYCIDIHPDPQAAPATTESAGRQSTATGHYTRVVPNELLQFTWVPSWMPGEESLVPVSLRDVDGGTEITIRHERYTDGGQEGYRKGWTACLDKLSTLFAA